MSHLLHHQVIDLRSQLSAQVGKLRSKDVYLQQADSRYLELETQLISLRSAHACIYMYMYMYMHVHVYTHVHVHTMHASLFVPSFHLVEDS